MYAFATKSRCPYCSYPRFWKLRREKRKCKRCRREWSGTVVLNGVRATTAEWRRCVSTFLTRRAARTVSQETRMAYCRVVKMLTRLRETMSLDVATPFSGICEADETFIGGQRKNKRLHIRRRPSKRGHGTEKVPIVGILSRQTGQVAVRVLSHRSEETVIGFMVSCLAKDAVLYTDGYKMNRAVRKHGIPHQYVDHASGEYVRGDVHTNRIEGFWGVLKRNLAMIGGIRPGRFPLFIGEIAWRYNHRKLTHEQRVERLMQLLFN